jgi:hypothetical protein
MFAKEMPTPDQELWPMGVVSDYKHSRQASKLPELLKGRLRQLKSPIQSSGRESSWLLQATGCEDDNRRIGDFGGIYMVCRIFAVLHLLFLMQFDVQHRNE